MKYLQAIIVCLASVGLSTTAAEAADISKLQSKEISETYTSNKSIYDMERCIILLDGPGLPLVYRQPDRPDFTMIAYGQEMGGVQALIEISVQDMGSKIDIRRRGNPFKMKPPEGLEGCL